jgi:glucose-6-phosphate 1-dehydrogenase
LKIKEDLNCAMVIFGATGDLTHKKLMPALYNLEKSNLLPEKFAVVAVGRRDKTSESYIDEIRVSIEKNIYDNIKDDVFNRLKKRIRYHKQDLADDEGYSRLKNVLKDFGADANILYYLAVSPQYFEIIIGKLDEHDMAYKEKPWRRVVIEKPFGRDLKTAEYLNKKITKVFPEENIYRIDHYLGKEMLQNLIVLRFANAFFEPVWNKDHIDNIQISSSETIGVETRGGYYEKSGALRDMVQNHLLQLLTLTAMEPPKSLDEQDIRNEKLKVLKSLNAKMDSIEVVRGQYGSGDVDGENSIGYRQEERVEDESNVETFVAMKLFIDNERWRGVPFYIRTGKKLKEKATEVVIEFKHQPQIRHFKDSENLKPNLLVIRIQPEEGMEFEFNTKKPGTISNIVPVKMDFCQNCQTGVNSPEAYERLLFDVIRGDATLFTRWEELKYSWIFTDNIGKVWSKSKPEFPNYKPGTWGPKEAMALIQKDGRKWWDNSGGSRV